MGPEESQGEEKPEKPLHMLPGVLAALLSLTWRAKWAEPGVWSPSPPHCRDEADEELISDSDRGVA